MRYKLFESESGANITVLSPDGELLAAADSHPHWDTIVAGARSDDDSIFALFDLQRTVQKNFEKVTERVSVRNGTIYLDGDPVNNALTKKAIDFLEAGEEDYLPLVKFFEKIQANPNEHSREQAYEWLSRHGFALDDDGNVIAYKGVRAGSEPGTFLSVHSGSATVNGVPQTGQIPQSVGDIVEMPRSEVQHDPSQGCHTGLHVGNLRYAGSFANITLLVSIDPRDIVSVPTDSNWEKVRVCRYKIVEVSDGTELGQRYYSGSDYVEDVDVDDDDDDYCEDCEEHIDYCTCDEETCNCCEEIEENCDCDEGEEECRDNCQFLVSEFRYTPRHF